MSYYEVKAVANDENSYFESRYYIQADNKYKAVNQVKYHLEIMDFTDCRFFTRELSCSRYQEKIANVKQFYNQFDGNSDYLRADDAIKGNFDENTKWKSIVRFVSNSDVKQRIDIIKQYERKTDIDTVYRQKIAIQNIKPNKRRQKLL